MLTAIPKSRQSTHYLILDRGTPCAHLHRVWFAERGEFVIDGCSYTVSYEMQHQPTFLLTQNNRAIAWATQTAGRIRRSLVVTYNDQRYQLKAASPAGRTFILGRNQQAIGMLYPKSTLSRTALIDFPEDLPIAIRLFMIWLALLFWYPAEPSAESLVG